MTFWPLLRQVVSHCLCFFHDNTCLFWLPSGPYFFISHEWKWVGNKAENTCRGANLHWKVIWGCATVTTPFFQASWHFLAYQFTLNAPLMCPAFSILRKIMDFQSCFGQNFSSQDANFPNFCSQVPSFSKENSLPRSYFWKPVWNKPTKKKKKKKSRVPPGTCFWTWPLLHLISSMYTC